MPRTPVSVLLAFVLSALIPAEALAHAVGVDCTLSLGRVEVEAFYDDDSAAAKAKMQVVNANGEIVAQGVTDQRGRWTFRKPAPGKYEVRVDAGAGHRTKKKIDVPAATVQEAVIGILLDVSLSIEAPAAAPVAPGTTISHSPARADFTRVPWEKVLIGIGIIGGLSGAFLLASLMRKNAKAKE